MNKVYAIALLMMATVACSGPGRTPAADANHTDTPADSAARTDSIEWYRARTARAAEEKSLYQKYLTASENAAFFSAEKMPLELGRNLNLLGDVMAQLDDTVRALRYYDQAAACFREASATEELYNVMMSRPGVMRLNERQELFMRLLADTAVINSPALHITALKGAYLATDSVALLDSCLALLDSDPSVMSVERPALLAMRAYESVTAGDLEDALRRIPRIKAETDSQNPIAQHREYIHVAIAYIYNAAGMKDSCINELQKVIWWTDSAYREANLPNIYSRETRRMIELTESNSRLEKRSIMLWWAISIIILLSLAAYGWLYARRRQARVRQEIAMLDSHMEHLRQLQTAQSAIMEENHRLMADLGEAVARHSAGTDTEGGLAKDIRRILSLYGSREDNRQGLLTVSRQIDPRFTSRLKADYPALSEGQLRLAALIAAGVDSSQLAAILNISSKSLYTSRYRLRASLGLSKNDSLEELLRSYITPPPTGQQP